MKSKTEKTFYTIVAGEGDYASTYRVVSCTLVGLKSILTIERCEGARWARAYYGVGKTADLQLVESTSCS